MKALNDFEEYSLGNICPNPRGAYSADEQYMFLDAVTYNGGSYFAKKDNLQGEEPKDSVTDDNWFCMAVSGQMTPEYIAMHDRVIDAQKDVKRNHTVVTQIAENVENIQSDITSKYDTVDADARQVAKDKDSTAGYSKTAQSSADAAKASESHVNDLVTGIEDTVASAKNDITEHTDQAREQAVSVISKQGEEVSGELDGLVETAEITKKDLDKSVTTAKEEAEKADKTVDDLNNSVESGNTVKSGLDKSITTAESTQTDLDNSNSTASKLNTDLKDTTGKAITAKTNLDMSVTKAGPVSEALKKRIDDAESITEGADIHAFKPTVKNLTGTEEDQALDATMGKKLKDDIDSVNADSKEILAGVSDLRAFLGLEQSEVAGITVDFTNKTFTRLAGAEGLAGGADFNKFAMYGGRKRCNVADDGTIAAWYGDADYKEDGSNGQVMVYQPKFFYRVVPIKIEPIKEGIGYHLRKANYYVSEYPLAGFKLHPAFYDAQGNEIDYILMGAYEGSIFDVSANAYILDDAQVMDYANDLFCSIAGAKPASGKTQDLTRPNVNQMCMNRGAGWYSDNIKAVSANQMLMVVEMGMMNMQTAIGQGVVSVADNPNTENNSKVTGGTSALGNETGQASGTSGQVSVSYRGYENPWGNIWKFIYGVNIWGDGTLGGGVPYYATDFNFAESKRTDNYVSAGFSCANAGGYISAIGYAPECDWMFIGSEVLGNSSVPVGDYQWITENLNGYRIARLGGNWGNGTGAGAFCWYLNYGVGSRDRAIGGRLVYVPTATA